MPTNELDTAAGAAAAEITRNLSAIKGEDGTHITENLATIIRSHYNIVQARAGQPCTWTWFRDGEHGGYWTADCKGDEGISLLQDDAKFCVFCGNLLIVESEG